MLIRVYTFIATGRIYMPGKLFSFQALIKSLFFTSADYKRTW